jgi:hypothetical protein
MAARSLPPEKWAFKSFLLHKGFCLFDRVGVTQEFYYNDQVKEDEIGQACSTYGEEGYAYQ